MKLLYDVSENLQIESPLNEAGQKKYKIKGIFSTIGEKNRNGRTYPKHLWEREVKEYQKVLESGSLNRLCEWQHPERSNVDPMNAVAVIDKLEIKDNYVMGEATLLDNEKANQLKSLIDNGIKISVSSRGAGSVKNGIVEDFHLITYDLVDNPSDYNATMEGVISESVKEFDYIDGKIVEAKESKELIEEPKEELNESKVKEIFLNYFKTLKD